MKNYKFIRTTCGLMATHDNHEKPKLVKAEYYENENDRNEIKLIAVSGNNLLPMKKSASVILDREGYAGIPEDPYDSTTETIAALNLLGWVV